jgi:chromosome segregation ATPase
MQDLRAAHERALLDARQSHQTEVDRLVQDYEKKLSNQNLDLKATKDDLVKAKSALPLVQGELESLKAELLKAQEAVKTASADDAASKQVLLLSEELGKTKKALQGLQSTHDTCKGQLASLNDRHAQELEQSVLNHVSTLSKLDQEYASEKEDLLRQISSLQQRNGELEVEVAALASEKAETHDPPSPTLPQVNGNVANAAIITREELSRMHEAHNLKIHEIEASYKKQVSELEAAVAAAVKHAEESEMTAERTGMENHFLRSEGEEYADRIKRYVSYRVVIYTSLALGFFYSWI